MYRDINFGHIVQPYVSSTATSGCAALLRWSGTQDWLPVPPSSPRCSATRRTDWTSWSCPRRKARTDSPQKWQPSSAAGRPTFSGHLDPGRPAVRLEPCRWFRWDTETGCPGMPCPEETRFRQACCPLGGAPVHFRHRFSVRTNPSRKPSTCQTFLRPQPPAETRPGR